MFELGGMRLASKPIGGETYTGHTVLGFCLSVCMKIFEAKLSGHQHRTQLNEAIIYTSMNQNRSIRYAVCVCVYVRD